jgi:hypothetical protein
LKNDERFAIRLANDGVPFLAEEGWNVLVETSPSDSEKAGTGTS